MGGGKGGNQSYQMDKDAVEAQTRANRVNQYTPWGSSEFTEGPGGTWSQKTTVDPKLQAALNAQFDTNRLKSELANSMFGRVGNDMATEMDWGNLPSIGVNNSGSIPTYMTSPTGQRMTVDQTTGADMANLGATGQQLRLDEQGLPERAKADAAERNRIEAMLMDRMNPQFEQDRQALETRLANQGLRPGSTAYKRAMESMNDKQTRAKFDAMQTGGQEMANLFNMQFQNRGQGFGEAQGRGQFTNQALNNLFQQNQGVQAGNLAAQQQRFNQGLAGGQFTNAALQQLFGQQLGANQQNFGQGLAQANFQKDARTQLLQERQAQKMQNLNFLNALLTGTQVNQPTFSNVPQADRANANLMNQPNSTMGDIGNLAKTGASMFTMFSDRRLKSDIERIGDHPLGIGIYSYTIFGEPQIGVMADEVERVLPAAVAVHPSGFKTVDYAMLGGLNG